MAASWAVAWLVCKWSIETVWGHLCLLVLHWKHRFLHAYIARLFTPSTKSCLGQELFVRCTVFRGYWWPSRWPSRIRHSVNTWLESIVCSNQGIVWSNRGIISPMGTVWSRSRTLRIIKNARPLKSGYLDWKHKLTIFYSEILLFINWKPHPYFVRNISIWNTS